MSTVLRKAEPADLESLAALRAESFGTDRAEAIDWLQKMAGLENVLLLAHTAGDSTAVAGHACRGPGGIAGAVAGSGLPVWPLRHRCAGAA